MSQDLDQIRGYMHEIQRGERLVPVSQTHLLELFVLMKSGLGDLAQIESANYTPDGMKVLVKFADKKTYEVLIREVVS